MGKFLGMGKSKGIMCTQNEDGSKTCSVFEVDGDKKVATGTTFNVTNDESCNAVLVGNSSIIEGDEDEVQKALKSVSQGCRKGLA